MKMPLYKKILFKEKNKNAAQQHCRSIMELTVRTRLWYRINQKQFFLFILIVKEKKRSYDPKALLFLWSLCHQLDLHFLNQQEN